MGRYTASEFSNGEYDTRESWSWACKGGNHSKCKNKDEGCGCGCHKNVNWLRKQLVDCEVKKKQSGIISGWAKRQEMLRKRKKENLKLRMYFCTNCLAPFVQYKKHYCPRCGQTCKYLASYIENELIVSTKIKRKDVRVRSGYD